MALSMGDRHIIYILKKYCSMSIPPIPKYEFLNSTQNALENHTDN